ncbi:uncharacterized protein LOC135154650 [Lytechinus pictus]|uniref:uncharacterized protein LOC135154650 n=1 Tax=Lytechinus pictus TaxID=7653 RepID=UPI0030B9E182
MVQTSTSNLPHSFSSTPRNRKPEWNKDVDKSYVKMKVNWKSWKDQGRPRSKENTAWISYKKSKNMFRRSLRQSRQRTRNEIIKEVESSKHDNPLLFSKLVKQHRSPSNIRTDTDSLIVSDKKHTGQQLLEGWEQYFRALSNPDPCPPCQVDEEVTQAEVLLEGTQLHVTSSQLNIAIAQLKSGKAGGVDHISPKHVKFSGPITRLVLVQIYNSILFHCHMPSNFKTSLILPIHKGKWKSPTDPSNYRGISLTTVFCKILELLIKPELEEALHKSNIPHELQSGFQEGHSCLLVAATLNLIIESNKKHTFIAYLDAANAFDTVWHNGLLLKLYKAGVRGNLWFIVKR